MRKILFGVTGIGLGHTFRQLPIIEHYVDEGAEVVIFAYDKSLDFYKDRFAQAKNVHIIPIAVPFFVGNNFGLDFDATRVSEFNKNIDFLNINCEAWQQVANILGKPDVVISDYDPVSAQYAYSLDVPLVTLDQQSKYLCGNFEKELGGFTYQDEIVRLHMFFPKTAARIAVSFFNVDKRIDSKDDVLIFSPVLRSSIVNLIRNPERKHLSVLVYISSARDFPQSINEIENICIQINDVDFYIYLPKDMVRKSCLRAYRNVQIHPHGDKEFEHLLESCQGIVSTAGHSLLSEAMYLGIPVYAIPVAPYEQFMNAKIIDDYSFGLSSTKFDLQKLNIFIENLNVYARNIHNDRSILMRGIGQDKIISFLEKNILF